MSPQVFKAGVHLDAATSLTHGCEDEDHDGCQPVHQ